MTALMGQPTLSDVKAWLGIATDDYSDDAVLTESLNAALAAQAQVCCYPVDGFGDPVFTDDLVTAIYLRTQRLAARRNSPDGVVGLTGAGGDFVGARVPSYDVDVAHLEGPHRKLVVS